jgi:hypothetical protein
MALTTRFVRDTQDGVGDTVTGGCQDNGEIVRNCCGV